MAKSSSTRLIAQNKKAYYDFYIEETFQAGIALSGTEVKSMRAGKCSLKESFVRIEHNEAFIYNMHISPYENGNIFNKDSLRVRKLLLHKKEIRKLQSAVAQDGFTIVPLRVYLARSFVKIDIAIARGKKQYDKRDVIAKKDQRRAAEKDFKVSNLYS